MWQAIKNIYHLFTAIIANIWFGFPSKNLIIVGVTGTDGKTTTASLIYHILQKTGKKTALITSISAKIGKKEYDTGFHVTTPSSFPLQKYIKLANNSGARYLVIEVTSHALHQNRVFGIPFRVGVITNITHEHLDYHKTYKNYVDAKIKLLDMANIVVLNRDDESFDHIKSKFAEWKRKRKKIITYSISNKQADIVWDKLGLRTKSLTEFNKENFLAAFAACLALGIDEQTIKDAISDFDLPRGRQEIVYDKDFCVMIDFAHTPNAFAKILPEVKKKQRSGRLIHVFGAAGERDASKRPLMGKIASEFDDIIVLTAEDPRSEKVEDINEQIKKGIDNKFIKLVPDDLEETILNKASHKYLFEIPDRKKAIEFAISLARKGDLVLLTGKSHEKSMNYGRGEESWDEYKTAFSAIKKREKVGEKKTLSDL